MTNDIAASALSQNYAPANYRSAEQVFGGNYPIHTPAGETSRCLSQSLISYLIFHNRD